MARTDTSDETGLLTRFVPSKLKHSALYPWFLRLVHVLQFISSVISLGLFSSRVYRVYRLVNAIKRHRGINHAYGAVEGILAAAVLYTLISMLLSFLLRGRGKTWLRWVWVLFDLAFVGAFIAVAVLTRPNGGPAGPRHCYNLRGNGSTSTGNVRAGRRDTSCNLIWGTFILAIISTVLHAITAAFHEIRDRHRKRTTATGDSESTGKPYEESKRSVDPKARGSDGTHTDGTHSNVGSYGGAGSNEPHVANHERAGVTGTHGGLPKHEEIQSDEHITPEVFPSPGQTRPAGFQPSGHTMPEGFHPVGHTRPEGFQATGK